MPHYLQLHRGTYRVRRVVPDRLVEAVGQKYLLSETNTDDFDSAKRIGAPAIKRFGRMIDRAAGRSSRTHVRHSQGETRSSEWYTPPRVFEAMPGVMFDMDVASPGRDVVPWIPAIEHITENSLEREWAGFILMNAPFGIRQGMQAWLDKFVSHRNGVAILPGNSYVGWWHFMAEHCDAVLFIKGYVAFLAPRPVNGRPSFGTNLFAIGNQGIAALELAARSGLGHVGRLRNLGPSRDERPTC